MFTVVTLCTVRAVYTIVDNLLATVYNEYNGNIVNSGRKCTHCGQLCAARAMGAVLVEGDWVMVLEPVRERDVSRRELNKLTDEYDERGFLVLEHLCNLVRRNWWMSDAIIDKMIDELVRRASRGIRFPVCDDSLVRLYLGKAWRNVLNRLRPWDYAATIAGILVDCDARCEKHRARRNPSFFNGSFYAQQMVLDAVVLDSYGVMGSTADVVPLMYLLELGCTMSPLNPYLMGMPSNSLAALMVRDLYRILAVKCGGYGGMMGNNSGVRRDTLAMFTEQSAEYTERYIHDLNRVYAGTERFDSSKLSVPLVSELYRADADHGIPDYQMMDAIQHTILSSRFPMYTPYWSGIIEANHADASAKCDELLALLINHSTVMTRLKNQFSYWCDKRPMNQSVPTVATAESVGKYLPCMLINGCVTELHLLQNQDHTNDNTATVSTALTHANWVCDFLSIISDREREAASDANHEEQSRTIKRLLYQYPKRTTYQQFIDEYTRLPANVAFEDLISDIADKG